MFSNFLFYVIFLSLAIKSFVQGSCATHSSYVNFTNQYTIYLSATQVNTSDQKTVISLYQNLSQIGTYTVSMNSFYNIYVNNKPTCLKNSTVTIKYSAKNDIWMCFDQYFLLTCNDIWQLAITCGTFIEVHRPFDPYVITSIDLERVAWISDKSGESITNMGMSALCAGTYHLWFVYYSRMGKFIKGVKIIYINYPSCLC